MAEFDQLMGTSTDGKKCHIIKRQRATRLKKKLHHDTDSNGKRKRPIRRESASTTGKEKTRQKAELVQPQVAETSRDY